MTAAGEAGVAGTSFPDAAVLRVFASPPQAGAADDALGVGFLVDERHALTCAHVVAAALGLAPGETPPEGTRVRVDVPLLPAAGTPAAAVTASVVLWGPSQAPGGTDLAVLRLAGAVPGAVPAWLADVEPAAVRGHAAQLVGFPEGRGQGVWHEGVLRGRQADGQIQVDRAGSGYRVTRGFSGGPVWDRELGGVVGMLARAELGETAAAFVIPVAQLTAAWPLLADLTRPPSPFRSLEPFEEAHAAAFFGRDADSDAIARVVGQQRWTTLVGPSGCGKSSLAMAGVAPRRRAAGDTVAVLRPAHHSTALRGLAAVLLDLLDPDCPEAEKFARTSAVAAEISRHGLREIATRVLRVQHAGRLLIVVDQFEELLDEEAFAPDDIAALADALDLRRPRPPHIPQPAGPAQPPPPAQPLRSLLPPPAVAVLAVLRTDFLGPVLAHPRLGLLAKQRIEALEPVRREQLADIVTKPVDAIPAVGYDDALVARILSDAGDAPGVLPLLSFTLAELWDHQRGGRLTHDAYDRLGGVDGALGRHADSAWAQCVGDGDEEHAERLLTRLVRTPLGTETPVRRLVTRAELNEQEWRIAQRLAGARLLVLGRGRAQAEPGPVGADPAPVDGGSGPAGTDPASGAAAPEAPAETVELAHEALISRWDRLSSRVTADRVFLDWRENLQLDLERWEKAGRPRDLLPGATTLEAAQRWLPDRTGELGDSQREFLHQGRVHRRRITRRRRTVMALFGALLLIVSATAAVAIDQRQTVVHQRDRATSAQVAALAQSLGRTDPQLARRLAVAADRLGDTPEAWSALLATRYQPEKRAVKLPPFDVTAADLDSTGRILVAAGGTEIGLWDTQTGRRLGSHRTATRVENIALSADASTVAVTTDDGALTVLDAPGLTPRGRSGYPAGGTSFALSATGAFLASSRQTDSGTYPYVITVWDTRTGKVVLHRGFAGSVSFSFSPDEKLISLSGVPENGVTWFDLHTGKPLPTPDFGFKPQDDPGPVAFGDDGQHVAVPTGRGLLLVDLFGSKVVYRQMLSVPSLGNGHQGDVHFSHGSAFLAVGFEVWDATFPDDPLITYPTVQSDCMAGTFRFSADTSEERCFGDDGVFRTLDISGLTPHGKRTELTAPATATSRDGSTIALADGRTAEIWSTRPLARRMVLKLPAVDRIMLSDDGRLLAAQSAFDPVQLWDLARRTRLGTLPGYVGGLTQTVAISPDDRWYATYDRVGDGAAGGAYVYALRFYDLRTMKLIRKTTFTLKTGLLDLSTKVVFRPDGKAVAVTPLLGLVAFPSGKVLVPGTAARNLDGFGPGGTTAYTDPGTAQSNLTFLDPRTLSPVGEPLNVGDVAVSDVPVAHSPDGRLIAPLYDDTAGTPPPADRVGLWDLRNRRQLGPALTGPHSEIELTAFTADDSTLVTLDLKGDFVTYTVSPAGLVHELCAMAGGGLTRQEWKAHVPDVPYRKTC